MSYSKMDTNRNQAGVVSAGSCYLMIPEIKGDWKVGPVENGHSVVAFDIGASKAVVPAENGLGLESARALGTLMSITLQKSAHQSEFVNASVVGKNLPKITVITLKNHGTTADEALRIELTNVRIVKVDINEKRKMGGYGPNGGTSSQQNNEPGWALDADANTFAQTQDPNAETSVADVFRIALSYSTFTIIHTAVDVEGKTGGKTPAFFDFIHNSVEAAK